MFMRNLWERGNELATVLISTYLRDLHWCTLILEQRYNFFMNEQKDSVFFIIEG